MKKKSTKRALLISVLSLLVCLSMLIGSTFAWFTDSVTSAGNKIQAGNLNIDMLVMDENGVYQSVKTSQEPIFADDVLWEPGYTEWRNVKVSTTGNLALKYQMNIAMVGESSPLADVIDVYYAASEIAKPTNRSVEGLTYLGTLSEIFAANATGALIQDTLIPETNTEDFATIVLKMQESAGNEYKGLSVGAFDIQILATQLTYENDSFDNQYDVDSQFPVIKTVNKEAGQAATVSTEDVEIQIPAAAPAGKYTIEVTNINENTDVEGNTTLAMDIVLKKDGVKVQADGQRLYLVEIDIGTDMQVVKVLHNGEEIQGFTYASDTGILKFETASFSPFVVIFEKVNAIKVTSVDELKAALENVTEPVVIDATGVSATMGEIGVLNNGHTVWDLDAGVKIKGLTLSFTASNQNVFVHDGAEGGELTFVGCTFIGEGYVSEAAEFHSGTDSANTKLVFENCTFAAGKLRVIGARCAGVEFNNCIFDLNSEGYGSILCMGGNQTFNQCEFKTGNSSALSFFETNQEKFGCLNIYADQYDRYSTIVTVNGCTNVPKRNNTNSGSYTNQFIENP